MRPEALESHIEETTEKGKLRITISFKNKHGNSGRVYHCRDGDRQVSGRRYGYIEFISKKSSTSGEVWLVNFDSKLPEHAFRIWESSKRQNRVVQAGRHGEGLKNAAIKFCVRGYSLSIMSDQKKFNFKENRRDNRRLFDLFFTTPKNSSWNSKPFTHKDVAVSIGAEVKGPAGQKNVQVEGALFREWLTVTCDINGPNSKVETTDGDLILDRAFENPNLCHGPQIAGFPGFCGAIRIRLQFSVCGSRARS